MNATILPPDAARRLVPELAASRRPDVWVHRFVDAAHGWTLAVATHAAPGSGNLSLGGFRIAPEARTSAPGFTPEREAIALAMGMEEKVHWSRVIGVGGPLARRDLSRIVGGKCVLAPTDAGRIGGPDDAALLDFAIAGFEAIERASGIHLVTGQDLGHGTMHDGVTSSLAYLNARYRGSVVADTSGPTAEGNVQVLLGMLRALGIAPAQARVALIGCGNIGWHMVERLHPLGVTLVACEARAARRAELEARGIRAIAPEAKLALLREPLDAVVVNAAGGSLDGATVSAILANDGVRVICGSENLAMPDPADADRLRAAGRSYCPTELGGMMGYLTAVEEYLAKAAGVPFEIATLVTAAAALEPAAYAATARQVAGGFAETFEQAVTAVSSDR
ncbi:MAG: hypothetical protein RL139_1385 [Gemmatimonadota bacterium]